jgi:predicted RNA-binding protein
MCESTAYLKTGEQEELLLEEVVMVRPENGRFILINILGDRKEVEAVIDHIDLLKHKIIFKPAS